MFPTVTKKRNDVEFQLQVALFNWASLMSHAYPELKLLRGSMNGVELTKAQAGKAKAAGMKKGELDVTLPVSRGGYTGLAVELKVGKNKPTPEQIDYGARLKAEGWYVDYVWDDWTKAADLIQKYLEGKLCAAQ